LDAGGTDASTAPPLEASPTVAPDKSSMSSRPQQRSVVASAKIVETSAHLRRDLVIRRPSS
jgi:hypothetical protein